MNAISSRSSTDESLVLLVQILGRFGIRARYYLENLILKLPPQNITFPEYFRYLIESLRGREGHQRGAARF